MFVQPRTPITVGARVALWLVILGSLFALVLVTHQPVKAQDVTDGTPPAAIFSWSPVSRPNAEVASSDETIDPQAASAQAGAEPSVDPSALTATKVYLPLFSNDYNPIRSDRIGFGAGLHPLSYYKDIRILNGGWYVDWTVQVAPERPAGIEFVQMVRVHQKLTCPIGTTADRKLCPYVNPPQYTISRPYSYIQSAARANPGSIWLIGNEMDRLDWAGGAQDEMTPELYAVAYHEIRSVIRQADPTARIAIGGIIQATPLRLQYLDKVWATYKARYGVEMPVDVWNVHNFIGSEYCRTEKVNGRNEYVCYGMAVPPGANTTTAAPAYVSQDNLHTNMGTFDQQIRSFRAWMKAKNQQNKPLIVSEYGVLYRTLCDQTNVTEKQNCIDHWNRNGGYVNLEDPKVVADFMISTFEYFAFARDCSLVPKEMDDCHLVQRWAWFVLEDLSAAGWKLNPHTALTANNALTEAGRRFGVFSRSNYGLLQYDD